MKIGLKCVLGDFSLEKGRHLSKWGEEGEGGAMQNRRFYSHVLSLEVFVSLNFKRPPPPPAGLNYLYTFIACSDI